MTRNSIVLLALLAGCGDVTGPGGGGADSAPGDGGPGADASAPGPVSVIVLDPDGTRAALKDVPVVFFEADGTEVDTVMTDDDGVATAELHAGGAVIAFVTSSIPLGTGTPLTWAVVDVHPGDEITLGGRRTTGEAIADMTIELPAMKGATFEVMMPCGSYGEGTDNVVTVSTRAGCELDSFAIVATATLGDEVYSVGDTGVTFDEGTNHVVSDTWEIIPTPDVTVEGIGDSSFMRAQWASGLLDGSNLPLGYFPAEGDVTGDVLTLTPRRNPEPDDVMIELSLAPEQAGIGGQWMHLWTGRDDDELLIDARDYLLPWIGIPVIDQTSRRVFWNHTGDGAWDATYVVFSWIQTDEKMTTAGEWRIVAPPGQHELVLPPVPDAYRDWLPADIDSIGDAYVTLFDSETLDWDGARQHGLDPLQSRDFSGTLAEPATHRYSSSYFD